MGTFSPLSGLPLVSVGCSCLSRLQPQVGTGVGVGGDTDGSSPVLEAVYDRGREGAGQRELIRKKPLVPQPLPINFASQLLPWSIFLRPYALVTEVERKAAP